MTTGVVTTDDGIQLYYEDVGSGKPVAFVHEFADDFRSWKPELRGEARIGALSH